MVLSCVPIPWRFYQGRMVSVSTPQTTAIVAVLLHLTPHPTLAAERTFGRREHAALARAQVAGRQPLLAGRVAEEHVGGQGCARVGDDELDQGESVLR